MSNRIFLSFFVFISLPVFSQSHFQDAIIQSKKMVKELMVKSKVPGAAVSLSINGQLVWSEGFGYADLEQGVKIFPDKTKFRIASISKSLTATAIALLFERGQIQLDSSIQFYMKNFLPGKYRPTVRQIAGHLGGIRHYRGNEMIIAQRYNTLTEGLSIFKNDSLLFKPGTKYLYSSYGFNLLGSLVEEVSQVSFIDFMHKEIIVPLKLWHTIPDFNDSIISFRARYYEKSGKNSPYVDNSYKWPGGGYLSTSEDLIQFGNSILFGKLLKPSTVQIFTTSQKLNNGQSTNYGMGWRSGLDTKGRYCFGHSGGAIGGTSNLNIYPKEKLVVVILTNVTGATLDSITDKIADAFLKAK